MPAICEDGQRHVVAICSETNTTTFQTDNSIITKLIWIELHRNLSDALAYLEMHLPDGQGSHGMGPDIPAIPNESV
jgi:hypothetical protein